MIGGHSLPVFLIILGIILAVIGQYWNAGANARAGYGLGGLLIIVGAVLWLFGDYH